MIFFLQIVIFMAINCIQTKPTDTPIEGRNTYARTELKVSRNLDTNNVQTLNIVTRDGSIAQLIVKKRDRKSEPQRTFQKNKLNFQENINNFESNTIKAFNDKWLFDRVPKPVTLRSDNLMIGESIKSIKKPKPVYVDADGIPVVEGVRVPDDDSDRDKIWRNARVINGQLYSKKANIGPFTIDHNKNLFKDEIQYLNRQNFDRMLTESEHVQIENKNRKPIYQYRHPEYGLQNVKLVTESFVSNSGKSLHKRHDDILKTDPINVQKESNSSILWAQFTERLKTSVQDFLPEAFRKISENFAFLRNFQRHLSSLSELSTANSMNKFFYNHN